MKNIGSSCVLSNSTSQIFNFVLQLDLDSPYPLLVYGGGILITLWLASAVVGSIDSIPVASFHILSSLRY